jgi:hypothetical protein
MDITKSFSNREPTRKSAYGAYEPRMANGGLSLFSLLPFFFLFTTKEKKERRSMFVDGNPTGYVDDTGNAPCLSVITGMIGLLGGGSFIGAALGTAPGHNYTGNGSCSKGVPDRFSAYVALFYYDIVKKERIEDKAIMLYSIFQFVEIGKRNGKGTPIDKLNTHRKEATLFLASLIANETINPIQAYIIYERIAKGGKILEPKNGIDRGSYSHDYSKGSTPVWIGKNDPRDSNKQWM